MDVREDHRVRNRARYGRADYDVHPYAAEKTQWQDETSNPLKRGDEVSVWLGYDDDLQLVFKGYILQKGFKAPLVIKCEDEMFQLKQTEAKKRPTRA